MSIPTGIDGSTRDRLLSAGIRLFAEKGFRETTVGEIEAAAGLEPRRGALYNHFPSKQALLEEAVRVQMEVIEEANRQVEALPGDDIRTEMLRMGRWFLATCNDLQPIIRILEQDGDRLPATRAAVKDTLIEAGHRAVAQLLRRRLGQLGIDADMDAFAALIIGPLANQRRVMWTFGAPPLGVDDDRLLEAWVGTFSLAFEAGVRAASADSG